MPLKILMLSTSTPRTLPNAVSATAYLGSAAQASLRMAPDAATNMDACLRKSRRDRSMTMRRSFADDSTALRDAAARTNSDCSGGHGKCEFIIDRRYSSDCLTSNLIGDFIPATIP